MKKAIYLSTDLLIDFRLSEKESEIILLPGSIEALRLFQEAHYEIVICNNEPGIATGFLTEKELSKSARTFAQFLVQNGIALSGFYYCPHLPNSEMKEYSKVCYCHKPAPGLLFSSSRDLKIDLASSWLVGEVLNDIEAGNRADSRTIFIDNGEEFDWDLSVLRCPNFTADNLFEAACLVMRQDMRMRIDNRLY